MSTDSLWFLDTAVTIRVSDSEGTDSMSVIDHFVRQGESPPLHIHHGEDEVFQILEGEFRIRVRDEEYRLGPGEIVLAPKGVPHTYRAESPEGGRFLTITVRGDFERFVRTISRPAEGPGLPEASGPPSPETMETLARIAGECGIEFVGPPLE